MCHHARVIYDCKHDGWGPVVKACKTETDFKEGFTDIGCAVTWSHGLHCRKVKQVCLKCRALNEKISEARGKIDDLKVQIENCYQGCKAVVPDELGEPMLEDTPASSTDEEAATTATTTPETTPEKGGAEKESGSESQSQSQHGLPVIVVSESP